MDTTMTSTDGIDDPDPHLPLDTGERAVPGIYTAAQRETLEGMLEWYRAGVLAKLEGMTQDHATAAPVRSGTSVAGVVKHLAVVEDAWFTMDLGHEGDPWSHACDRSRAVAAGRDLDAGVTSERGRDITLRELADGTTGE